MRVLVVDDLRAMPVMDGIEFVRNVRASLRHRGIKVTMVTARDSSGEVKEALQYGAGEFPMKPADCEMLTEKMRLAGLQT